MSVHEAIDAANRLLAGTTVEAGLDPRWQAIIDVEDYVETNPTEVWNFAAIWGCSSDPGLQAAVATCLVEHLLEHHFEQVFPQAATLGRSNPQFAKTLWLCWRFGEAETSANAKVFDALLTSFLR